MTDRELLERAAKAAGYKVAWEGGCETGWMAGSSWWNPLTDDGDALRLAVKLRMIVNADSEIASGKLSTVVRAFNGSPPFLVLAEEPHGDPYAATRRAIVRAAAEIGKDMQ